MHQKMLLGTLLTAICLLFIISSGCTSIQEGTSVPDTKTPVATETPAVMVTPLPTSPAKSEGAADGTRKLPDNVAGHTFARDAEFHVFVVNSAEEITNKTVLVVQAMLPGTSSAQLVYSPSVLYLRAEDLGYTTEKDYAQLFHMETTTPENEAKRIAYLKFLYSTQNAAYHLADAAEAESLGDYQNALDEAIVAKEYLQTIERNPDLPPITPYNTLDAFLNEYIGRMRDKVIASKIGGRDLGGDRFPRVQ
jgi:hypothetical protein